MTMENPDFNREFVVKFLRPGGGEVPYHAGNDGKAHGAEEEVRRFPPLLYERPGTDRPAGLANYLAPDIKRPIDRTQAEMIYKRLSPSSASSKTWI